MNHLSKQYNIYNSLIIKKHLLNYLNVGKTYTTLSNKKINELRRVIRELTEVRSILNKYISSHFEHFTVQEKEIIKNVSGCGITNSDKYNKPMNQLLETNEYGIGNYDN